MTPNPGKINSFHLDWLLAPRGRADADISLREEACGIRRLDYNIDPKQGQAFVENLNLAPGFDLYRAVHHLENAEFGQLIPLVDIAAELPEPVVSMQIWLAGIGCHQEYWHGRKHSPIEVIAGPGRDTFRIHKAWDSRVLVEGGGTSEMRSLIASFTVLEALLGAPVRDRLLEKLGLHDARPTVVVPMAPHVSQPLRDALSEQYIGQARRLFAQSRALDYLGRLVCHVNQDDEAAPPRRHSAKLRDLKDCLLNLEGRLPTLNQLAKDFGLSAKQLNTEFTAEFGQSIFAFITDHRLNQAHAALLDNTVPMKVISERLGYSHVNHFITAFKRKFGYSPGSLRTDKRKRQ